KKNKKRAGRSIKPLRNGFVSAQSLAQGRGEPCQDQTPNRSGRDKREPERDERGHFHVRRRIDELRQEREKEKRNFGIEHVRQDSLSKRVDACPPAKVRRQTQLPSPIEDN